MKKIFVIIAVSFLGFFSTTFAQTIVPNKTVPDDPKRLVDGVTLDVYQSLQVALLESSADDPDIAIIDDQMDMLRERRADLSFRAAAKAHPELKDQLAIIQAAQKQRLLVEKTLAKEAKRAAKKKN